MTATVHELRLNPRGQVRRALTELHDFERIVCSRVALIERIAPGCTSDVQAAEVARSGLRRVAQAIRNEIASIELAAKRAALED